MKNVAQGRFEYSHSPDNRALTKPYPVTTYLVANKLLQPILRLSLRPLTQMQGRYPTGQVLITNLNESCLLHQERELGLVRKFLDRRRKIGISTQRTAHEATHQRQYSSEVQIKQRSQNRIRRS